MGAVCITLAEGIDIVSVWISVLGRQDLRQYFPLLEEESMVSQILRADTDSGKYSARQMQSIIP